MNLNNKLICGDWRDVTKSIESESIDCVITDPPYWTLNKWRNVGTTTRLGGHRNKEKQDESKWFDTITPEDLSDLVQEVYRLLKPNTHAYFMCDFETLKHLYYFSVEENVFPLLKVSGVSMIPAKALIYKAENQDNLVEKIALRNGVLLPSKTRIYFHALERTKTQTTEQPWYARCV